MAWIKVEQSLHRHRKIFHLADLLGIHEMQAVGHITALWAWAIDSAPDGALRATPKTIAVNSCWEGRDAIRFVQALIDSGFVDDNLDGGLSLHAWDEWAGALVRKRKADRDRIQEHRARAKESPIPDRFYPEPED